MPLSQSPVLRKMPLYELNAEPLVNGIWSSSFQRIGGLKISHLRIMQTNGEAAAKDLNIRMIIDGIVYEGAAPLTFNSGAWYYMYFIETDDYIQNFDAVGGARMMLVDDDGHNLPIECSNLQLLVGLDSVAGSNQVYYVQIRYNGS